ncbi:uncharacterized protein SPPG_01592 [Spizellomyces punctatus DAOM BR117]|uniref:AB hydrolase-1 domain-containing protein n=1 Tax=Spizellomyces punctatus (strain DAOM BR117) TaxID=645134 RepID=A0A0L0HSV9_SPIPD|nr:uncharacterized protein SPPG_01592 [Spizellomyces punctatus DAOM BR117]KND04157.1 hypothetical protein SPPG_01592 [Spizellomyces punctatus DAOM BR117]|eukprot:XP_016612196.1 hypothetical protein SPPG_01592 [Spizellomyces punctatus DAOM BR117]
MGLLDLVQWVVQGTVYVGLTAVTGGLFLLYFYQNNLIYPAHFPPGSRQSVSKPDEFNLNDYEDVTITTPDNVKIKAFLIRRPKGTTEQENETVDFATALRDGVRKRGPEKQDAEELAEYTLIYCHANAGNMGHRLPIAKVFHSRCNANVVMFSYRGYGQSEGSPSEAGLKIDAQATLDWVLAHPQLRNTKIVVYGQSLGGAVAIHLASTNEDKIAGLIVENTFLSLPKVVPHILPYLKYLTFLCTQVWDSETTIQRIPRLPILLLSGGKDELIPPSQMAGLCYAARSARGKTKAPSTSTVKRDEHGIRFIVFPNGTHNETCVQRGYFDEVLAFWRECIVGDGSQSKSGETLVPKDVSNVDGVLEAYKTIEKGGEGSRLVTGGLGVPRM